MSGNINGGKKRAETIKSKYGQDFYQIQGKIGGSAKVKTKGFGSSHERAVEAGRKGGLKRWTNHTPPVTESPSQTITIKELVPVTKHWFTFPSFKKESK